MMPELTWTKPPNGNAAREAFTLIELVLALAISGVVLAAVNAVFFGALRLRTATVEATQQTMPVERAINALKLDLSNIVPPGTNTANLQLAGPMSSDTTAAGQTQPVLLEIYTASGLVGDEMPYGDIQKIDYWLQEPANRRTAAGKDLVRGITRNLLASTPDAPQPQVLIGDVQNFRFSYFDGTNWNDTWSVTLTNIPAAIKVFMTFAMPKTGKQRPPVQLLVPVTAWNSGATNTAQ